MNRIMAFMFFMLFLAGMAFVMLKDMGSQKSPGTSAADAANSASLIDGDWRPAASEQAFVRFLSDGKVNGFAGCNRFFGSYVATDKTIEIGPLGSTRMACDQAIMAAENEFLAAIQSATRYRTGADQLILTSEDGSSLQLMLSVTESPKKEE